VAYSWTTNTTPATAAIAVYTLIARLIAAGWTKKTDADGTTFSSSGTQVTSGLTGTNGLGNSKAWVRLQSPAGAGSTEIVIQRGTTSTTWRIKVSMAAGFTGGSPSGTQVPSATDEFLLMGSGTDAAPGFATWFGQSDNTYRFSCGADNAAPYTFWCAAWVIGGLNATTAVVQGFVFDSFTNTAAGDGYKGAFYWAANSAFDHGTGFVESAAATSPQLSATAPKASPTSADWSQFPPMQFATVAAAGIVPYSTGGLPTDTITHKSGNFPMICMRRSALSTSIGYKGILSAMQWLSTYCGKTIDTQDQAGTRDRIIINDVSLPWDGSQVVA
jgi:hypothetical protein